MATALSEDRLRGGGGGGDASDMACIMRICQPMREQDPIILISLWPDSVYYNYIILPLSYFISYFLLYLPASGPDPVRWLKCPKERKRKKEEEKIHISKMAHRDIP